jgi:large subunit ribosomal protein L25
MAVQAIELQIKARPELGSRANKRLRDGGQVPGVIYGHKEAVVPVTLPKRELTNHLEKGAHVFSLKLDGKAEQVLIKDIQWDHLGSEIIHVDFTRVSLDEKVKVTVPIELKGTPKGEADGGVLHQVMAQLEVECRVLEIPDAIRHNVSEMALNDVLHVRDLKLPADVRAIPGADLIVATVKEIQEEVAATEAAEAGTAEPEIIGRKAGEEGEAAEGAAAAGEKEKK